jgi:hypothetical protein
MLSRRIIRQRLSRIARKERSASKTNYVEYKAAHQPSRFSSIYAVVVSVVSALFVVLSVVIQNYITSAQLTATFDVLRIGEENRVFSEYLADAQTLCSTFVPQQIKDNYEVAFADKDGNIFENVDGDIARLVIARRQIDYTEVTNFRPERWSITNTSTFVKMTHLYSLLQRQPEGEQMKITFDFINAYSIAKAKIDNAFRDNVSMDELATLYVNGEAECYSSLVFAVTAFVHRQYFNGTRIELRLLPNADEGHARSALSAFSKSPSPRRGVGGEGIKGASSVP